jgi:cytochrome c5
VRFPKLSLLGLLVVTVAYTGCEDPSAVHFSDSSGAPITSSSSSATTHAVQQFKPGLAVRGMSCLACHAKIQAGVITDFGYGDPWYMDESMAAANPV